MQYGNAPKNVDVEPVLPEKQVDQPERTGEPGSIEIKRPVEKKEQPVEVHIERPKELPKTETGEQPLSSAPPPAAATVPVPAKSETYRQIEQILEDDLFQVYQAMDEPTKRRFRDEGEKTTSKIEVILQATKIQVKKILDLIKNWLKIIPRINKHFLTQEAKIKTDRIIALKDNQK
ncbi:MAG: hypothetical protein WC497_00905 [Patescibacteria group bacterium]